MDRVPEPEVMDDVDQALAYARADFGDVNQRFVDDLLERFPDAGRARVLDLGCGPADIPLRLVLTASQARVVGVDASLPMLRLGVQAAITARGRGRRLALLCARLPALPLADGSADVVISNSLLHHLPEASALWAEVARLARPGGAICVMDLFRPDSVDAARAIVETAAGKEDPLLKRDFFNSLLAAFTPEEVRAQLAAAGLGHLACIVVSERHLLVWGRR